MQYQNIVFATFLSRPNRFLASIELSGKTELCHVKNTSRLSELLLPGVQVSVQKVAGSNRKTCYDLIAVQHQGFWVNIDSQAPNKVFGEWVRECDYFGHPQLIRPETVYGKSRFDYYLESGNRKIFIEVKGVTLVENGIARFPGAPTTRGARHMQELASCLKDGYDACAVFIVKRGDVHACGPNDALDPAFSQALRQAAAQGVRLLALDCAVSPDSLAIRGKIPFTLG